MVKDKIILGIDPGTNIMGYGLINVEGSKINYITMNVLKLPSEDDHPLKLKKIFETCLVLIDQYHPDELAIEAPFYGKNVQSMLKLGRAQGVAIAAALFRSMPIFEYSPKKVKQSITGNGNASKEQVAGMLRKLLTLTDAPAYFDATDGLAVAVCHSMQNKISLPGEKYNSWKTFIANNPERIK